MGERKGEVNAEVKECSASKKISFHPAVIVSFR